MGARWRSDCPGPADEALGHGDAVSSLTLPTGGSRPWPREPRSSPAEAAVSAGAIVDRFLADGIDVLTCGRGDRPADLARRQLGSRRTCRARADAERILAEARAAFRRGGDPGQQCRCPGGKDRACRRPTTIGTSSWASMRAAHSTCAAPSCRGWRAPSGAIVNIGSISGMVSDPSLAVYNASKAFVHSLTRSIAVDHGPKVRCNAVSPGWIVTAMAEDAFALAKNRARQGRCHGASCRSPTGRIGRHRQMVAWLASDQSEFATGQCLTSTAASPPPLHSDPDYSDVELNNTAVLGAGVIGVSWTALFLASGRNVAVYDTESSAEKDAPATMSSGRGRRWTSWA